MKYATNKGRIFNSTYWKPRSESMERMNYDNLTASRKSYFDRLGGLVNGYNALTFRRIRLPLSSGFLEPFNPHMIANYLRTHY
jgi:hypothetical protein